MAGLFHVPDASFVQHKQSLFCYVVPLTRSRLQLAEAGIRIVMCWSRVTAVILQRVITVDD